MKNSKPLIYTFLSFSLLCILTLSCTEQREDISKEEVKEPEGIIVSLKDGKEFYDTYSERRANLIRKYENSLNKRTIKKEGTDEPNQIQESESDTMVGDFVPTRYVEFDYEKLKSYIKFIEQEADGAEVSISNLRIYLTNYPNKDKFEDGKPIKEPRRNSVMMVPTTTNGKKDFAFYTADDSEDGQRKAYLLTEELQETGESTGGKQKTKASLAPGSFLKPAGPPPPPQNQQSLYGNEGGLRPPS
ncbi:hypothetical protein B0O79_0826 [Flavobacteriaceae bacterium MAR_2009_75]|nr:hypothetical protein B0O79_0826 [Flavobacteriaceae bacterium MAR_2009_75]